MAHREQLGALSRLSAQSLGVFRGRDAVELAITRKQLLSLRSAGIVERLLPDTYRMTAVACSAEQSLRAALMWAGEGALAADRSAGALYRLEGVYENLPTIVVPRSFRGRDARVVVRHSDDRAALMARTIRGMRVTGPEATIVSLASALEPEELEIACEDARRRRLTSVSALLRYVDEHAARPGFKAIRRLVGDLDPAHPSRSALEVKTRRLLVANGLRGFVREFPLTWNGRRYLYDFAFTEGRTILETNGRRWHDDPSDYERDNEKWSVPGRLGYRIVFATWAKVTAHPSTLLDELTATLAA